MSYQFMHVEGYARTAGKGKAGGHNMASIVAEAERAPGACPHVATPARPRLLYGVAPAEAASEAQAWAEQATDARGHKLRKDALCLLGGVISMPPDTPEKAWNKYRDDSLKWLKKEYGDRLRSVVEHTDEGHPHIHFYAVPKVKERFDVLHAGLAAARAANPERGKRDLPAAEKASAKKDAMLAYKDAMREFQDRFFQAVSRKYGLARIGPKRRRLTRAEWKSEQQAQRGIAASLEALEAKKAEIAVEDKKLDQQYRKVSEAVRENGQLMKEAFEVRQEAAALLETVRSDKFVKWWGNLFGGLPQERWPEIQRAAQEKSDTLKRDSRSVSRGQSREKDGQDLGR